MIISECTPTCKYNADMSGTASQKRELLASLSDSIKKIQEALQLQLLTYSNVVWNFEGSQRQVAESFSDWYYSVCSEELDELPEELVSIMYLYGIQKAYSMLGIERPASQAIHMTPHITRFEFDKDKVTDIFHSAIYSDSQIVESDLFRLLGEMSGRGLSQTEINSAIYDLVSSNLHGLDIRLRATIRTEGMRVFNEANLEALHSAGVTEFRIITNDPCPICQELASQSYTYEEANDYSIGIEVARQMNDKGETHYNTSDAARYYAQNPYIGLLPVHVNCQCIWAQAIVR